MAAPVDAGAGRSYSAGVMFRTQVSPHRPGSEPVNQVLIVLLSVFLLHSVACAGAPERPWFVNTSWLKRPTTSDACVQPAQRAVDVSVARGCTAMSFDIPWSLEQADGGYDFTQVDKIVDYTRAKGLGVFVRVDTSLRHGWKFPWMTDPMLMCTKDGEVYVRRSGRRRQTVPAITHPKVLEKMCAFYTAIARHFRRRKVPVICYSAAFNLYMESEYFAVGLDYSASARETFTRWVREKGKRFVARGRRAGAAGFDVADEALDLRTAPRALVARFRIA